MICKTFASTGSTRFVRAARQWLAAAALGAAGFATCAASAQSLRPDEVLSTISLNALAAPEPVLGADNRIHLAYELLASNPNPLFVTLDKVEAIDNQGHAWETMAGVKLAAMLTLQAGTGTTMRPGGAALIFMDASFPAGSRLPPSIAARVTLTRALAGPDGKPAPYPPHAGLPATINFVGAKTSVSSASAVVIDPPLRGPGWAAVNGCCDALTSHRSAAMAVNGILRIGQRFAIDWVQLRPDGRLFAGERTRLDSYAYFGAPVYAVADGTVVNIYRDAQEQVPGVVKGITPADIGGNMIVVDIGGGNYAFFAHLKPGSLKVALGQHVSRGQVIAQLGNTGNTDAPHLHFHVMDGLSPLNSNGRPYVFSRFAVRGSLEAAGMGPAFTDGKPAIIKSSPFDGPHTRQLPLNAELVDFAMKEPNQK